MRSRTPAQQLLIRLGVDPVVVMLQAAKFISKSHTKRGPGRRHQQGKIKKVAQ